MASLLIVIVVVAIAVVWIRGARRNRLVWLKKLNLPGRWQCEQGQLALEGELNGGRYRLRDGAREDSGRWLLEGNDLMLVSDKAASQRRYDLRYFGPGKIGVDGPGLPRRVYERIADNVVSLRVRDR